MSSIAKVKYRLASKPADWVASPRVDRNRMEAGLYKFDPTQDNRGQDRISHRELAHISVAIQIESSQPADHWMCVQLWDFNAISFGILLGGMEENRVPAIGQVIRVRLGITPEQSYITECEVKNRRDQKGKVRLGLRRLDIAASQAVEIERRENQRLQLAPGLALKARIKHPFIYGHWCELLVADINQKMGFSMECRDPSVLVFEGMRLDIHFELSGMREKPMVARVQWVFAADARSMKCGLSCVDMELELHNRICDYLLVSRHWPPARLREAGFQIQQVKSRLRFRTAKTMDDYSEVLYLRRDAYVGAGKRDVNTRPEAMAAPLDGKSRIIMAIHEGVLVGTMTFTYPDSEALELDSQVGFPDHCYPVKLPAKTDLIEVSRLCIHANYRSTDLLQGLFEHGIQHFLTSDRHWLLTSAVDDLLPLYLRIGFKRVGASYSHPSLNHLEHHLILAHRDAFLWGRGVNVWVWNGLFGDVIRFVLNRHAQVFNPLQKLRARLKLMLYPLARRLSEKRRQAAFQKHLQWLRQVDRIEG